MPHRPALTRAASAGGAGHWSSCMSTSPTSRVPRVGRWNCNRDRLSRITSATLEILARDADMQAVLFHGAKPLAVSRKLRTEKIPDEFACPSARRGPPDARARRRATRSCTTSSIGRTAAPTTSTTSVRSRGTTTSTASTSTAGRSASTRRPGSLRSARRDRTWRSLPRSTGLARPPDNRPDGRASPDDAAGRRQESPHDPLPFERPPPNRSTRTPARGRG